MVAGTPRWAVGGHVEVEDDARFIAVLLSQGVSQAQILGIDANGIPLVCSTKGLQPGTPGTESQAGANGLPAKTRAWECIPGVIRNDGVDTFLLEVDTNGEAARVTLNAISRYLVPPETPPVALRDDGLDADRLAGDFVFTAGPFRYGTSVAMPTFYLNDPSSPAGLSVVTVGTVTIEELDATTTRFLIAPEVGLLRSDIPEIPFETAGPNMLMAPHLLNLRSDVRETQRVLRFLGGNVRNVTSRIYEMVPDAVDFFMLFSTNKLERLPRTASQNFTAGVHSQAQTDFTGSWLTVFDGTAPYGSSGVLLGVNVMDAYRRGVVSNNVTHELMHQWVSYTDIPLGLSDGTGHYRPQTSAASLVGGVRWTDHDGGTFMLDCEVGRSGAFVAPAMDKYMMGLIEAGSVPPLHVNDEINLGTDCGTLVVSAYDVTIEDIQAAHGVRTPGPADSQRSFRIAFVAESHNRFLNPTELTYYNMLAEHYAKPVPPEEPDPYLGSNWASIDRFFGEGTTWSTVIPLFHDADGDRDVDLHDFAEFGRCLSGTKQPLTPGCEIFDRDHDRDVDLSDVSAFQNAFTGPA